MKLYTFFVCSLAVLVRPGESAALHLPQGHVAAASNDNPNEAPSYLVEEAQGSVHVHDELPSAPEVVKRSPQDASDTDGQGNVQEVTVPVYKTITLTTRSRITRTSTITYIWTTAIVLPGPNTTPASSTASSSNAEPVSSTQPTAQVTVTETVSDIQQALPATNQTVGEVEETVEQLWVEIQIIGQGIPNITVTLAELPPAAKFLTLPGSGQTLTPLTNTKTNGAASSTRPQSDVVATSSVQNDPTTRNGFKTLFNPKADNSIA